MAILSGFFNSRDKPIEKSTKTAQNAISGNSYYFNFGSSASSKPVTPKTSMQMTAVYACVRVIAEAVAQLPLHVYRYGQDGRKEKAIEHDLYWLLHNEPNDEMTSFVFREAMMTNLLLWGNAYAFIELDGLGRVRRLIPLLSSRMTVDRDENQNLIYKYQHGADESASMPDSTITLYPYEVLHIPALGFDGVIGYSPIAMAKNAIGLAISAEEYGSKFYSNGASLSGVLEHPGTIKDPSKVREAWQSKFSGSTNAGKVAVLEEGMKFSPISANPSDAQFIDTRKFQNNEIARIFRVPPHMIADLDKSSFSNIEQQALEFVKYTLDPWLVRLEQSFERKLLTKDERRNMFIKFNVDGLLRGDYNSRMTGYATARQNGWMSANDIRELENMNRIPAEDGGDLYLVNGNMLPLKDAGAYANKNTTTTEQ